jgi:predicted O-methyltransferase YrrM
MEGDGLRNPVRAMTRIPKFEAPLEMLLDRLYASNDAQGGEIGEYFGKRAREGTLDWSGFDEDANRFLADKLVALDREKAEFCYQLCLGLGATRIVEAGTSFGVSTLFLAAAVRDNGGGTVIGTEYEPDKANAARMLFAEAKLADYIDLREGDLRETLRGVSGPIDFMLIDIWTPMARPAIELIAPRLRKGAIVVCDNTAQFPEAYTEYFAFLHARENGFSTMTLPFEGGLELSVRLS